MVTITESAREYLKELLDKQSDALGVRVFINNPGTPRAETCIAYCREGDMQESDVSQDYDLFSAWIEERSIPFLEDAVVDYAKDRMGGQLTIKAPNAKMPCVDADSSIEDRINYVLYNEVNPSLSCMVVTCRWSRSQMISLLFFSSVAAVKAVALLALRSRMVLKKRLSSRYLSWQACEI